MRKNKTVGEMVVERMRELGTYPAQVARDTGIAPSNLSDIIKDKRGLGPANAIALGSLLGLDPTLFDRRAQAKKARRASGGPRRPRVASPAGDSERQVA